MPVSGAKPAQRFPGVPGSRGDPSRGMWAWEWAGSPGMWGRTSGRAGIGIPGFLGSSLTHNLHPTQQIRAEQGGLHPGECFHGIPTSPG